MENIRLDCSIYYQYYNGIKPVFYFAQLENELYRYDCRNETIKRLGERKVRKDRNTPIHGLNRKHEFINMDEVPKEFENFIRKEIWKYFKNECENDTSYSSHWDKYKQHYSIPYSGYSDYSGCAVERANYDYFMKEYDFVSDIGSGIYGTDIAGIDFSDLEDCQGEYLPDIDTINQFIDEVNGLESYPAIDDESVSFKEMELIEECWTSYGRSDFKKELTSHIEYLIGEGKLQPGNLLDEYGEVDLTDYDEEIEDVAWNAMRKLPYGPEIETGRSVYFDFDMMLNEIDITDLWIFTNEHCMIDVHQLKLFGPKWINPSELVQ